MRVFAVCALWTESCQVVHAENSSYVAMAAVWAVAAEATVVPRTLTNLGLGVDVQERTLLVVAGV